MKFPKFDFEAIQNMYNSLSDEEKANLAGMAQDMMQNMPDAASMAAQAASTQPEEEEEDFYTRLHLDEDLYSALPGQVLDQIEAASDLEAYYEEDSEADFSASVLFYAKALLGMLRKDLHKHLMARALTEKSAPSMTLFDYFSVLSRPEVQQESSVLPDGLALQELLQAVQAVYILLMQAEYASITREQVQQIKTILLDNGVLLALNSYNH